MMHLQARHVNDGEILPCQELLGTYTYQRHVTEIN
jgi:hypothetical protein